MDALLVEVDGGRAEEEFGEALEAVSRLARAQSHALSVWVAVGESGPAPAAVEGLVRLCLLGLAGGAERVFWPGFRGDGPTSLIGADLTLQPPYAAYRTMTRLLEGAECRGPMSAPHGVRAIAFAKHRQELLAFWALEGVAEVELLGTDILRWDVAGHASRIAHGPIHVAVGASPIYAVGHSLRLASR